MKGRSSRRQFLAGSAVTVGALGAQRVSAGSARVATLAAASGATVVLHDVKLAMDPGVAARLAANGARVIALTDDPVRMWRGELGAVLRDPSTRLLGVTHWADFLIVRGLAAESRRHVRFEKLEPAAGTFTWLIG